MIRISTFPRLIPILDGFFSDIWQNSLFSSVSGAKKFFAKTFNVFLCAFHLYFPMQESETTMTSITTNTKIIPSTKLFCTCKVVGGFWVVHVYCLLLFLKSPAFHFSFRNKFWNSLKVYFNWIVKCCKLNILQHGFKTNIKRCGMVVALNGKKFAIISTFPFLLQLIPPIRQTQKKCGRNVSCILVLTFFEKNF